jgi:phage terminase large subunit
MGPPPKSIVTKVGFADNPFFVHTAMPHEAEVMRLGNERRYRHVWGGEYDDNFESRVYTNVEIGRPDFPSNCPVYYGMDFGFSVDPSTIIKVFVNEPTKELYIAQEAGGRYPMDQLPAVIGSVTRNSGDIVYADSSQPGTIQFLQSRGVNVLGARKGQGSVQSGIQLIQGYKIWCDPDCSETATELRLYSWCTDNLTGKVLPGNPVGCNDHYMDALRYALENAGYNNALEEDPTGGVVRLSMFRRSRRG